MQRAKPRSADQWSTIIDAYQQGNETEQEFCVRQAISIKTFRKWKYRFAAKSRAPNAAPTAQDQLPSSGFVEISLAQKPVEPVRVVFNGLHIECTNRDQVGLTVEIIRGLTDGR